MSGAGDIWYASFTKFVDDYKLRGEFPSTTNFGFYSSRKKAEEFLCGHIKDALTYEDVEIKTKNYDSLSELLTTYLEENPSEFIPCEKYQWELLNATKAVEK